MTLKEFEQRMAPILLEAAKEGFTGKVTFDIVFGEGGIRKVSVVRSHDMSTARTTPHTEPILRG